MVKLRIYSSTLFVGYGVGLAMCEIKRAPQKQICRKAFGRWLKLRMIPCLTIAIEIYILGHPGLDLDVGEFLDSLQLNNLKDIFEKEQASSIWELENTVFKSQCL